MSAMSKMQSLAWGILASIGGGIIGAITKMWFVNFGFAIALYYLYLKKKGVQVGPYILGFFLIAVILLVFLAGLIAFLLYGASASW